MLSTMLPTSIRATPSWPTLWSAPPYRVSPSRGSSSMCARPKPMPWDPANFTVNFSFNKQAKIRPSHRIREYQRLPRSFAYNYTPMIKGLRPLGWLNTKNRNLKFFKEWN